MSATMESTCKACGGSGVVGFDRTCGACDGIGATPDQIAAFRVRMSSLAFSPAIECETCGNGFVPVAGELRCERCRCPTCGDLPYSYVRGDQEIGDCCPECGRGDEEP